MLEELKNRIKNFHYREVRLDKQSLESLLSNVFNQDVVIIDGLKNIHWSPHLDNVLTVEINNESFYVYINHIAHHKLSEDNILITIEDIEGVGDEIIQETNYHLTTRQFINALKRIKDIEDYEDFKILIEIHDNRLDVAIQDKPDDIVKRNDIFEVSLNYENEYQINDDLIFNLRPKDQTKFLSLLLRYTQTPVEFR